MTFLKIENISKQEQTFGLGPISFTHSRGQKLAVMGATGSGKSTLLKIIAGLAQPDGGAVYLNGKKIKGPDEKLLPGHPQIAYLSQHFELRNNYRVKEELDYTNQLAEAEAIEIFRVCRIEHLLERWTNQLSGGERQRIAMARQLISAPELFLLDEPFSNLDLLHKGVVKSVIKDIGERLGITCILVSHEPHDVLPWADELLVLEEGMLAQKASPEQLYHKPANAYVAGLLGPYNLIKAKDLHLFNQWNIDTNYDKDMILRPEQLSIDADDIATVAGTVKSLSFNGAFYEAKIEVAHLTLTVNVIQPVPTPGEVVRLKLNGSYRFV